MAPKSTTPKKKDQAMTAAVSRQASREDRLTAIGHAMAAMNKNYGNGTIMRMGDIPRQDIRHISTGILSVDLATGIGGLPRGRITEIFGPESSGKTSLALLVIAEAQKQGGLCAFVDAEHALDPEYAKKLGVNLQNLYISQPDTGEQALEVTEALIRSGAMDVIVIDSVAALVPKNEVDGVMGDSVVGLQARLMSQAMRKLTGIIHTYGTVAVFINQLREKIGNGYGISETTTGGRALKFYASMRIDIRPGEKTTDKGHVLSRTAKVRIVKNKVAPPFKTASFEFVTGEGVSRSRCLLDLAVEDGLIHKSGAWFSLDGLQLGQGRENAALYLDLHPDVYQTLYDQVLAAHTPYAGTGNPGISGTGPEHPFLQDFAEEPFSHPEDGYRGSGSLA